MSIFDEWQRLGEVKVLVLDCGALFKDYDLHKVTALSADIAGIDTLSLNYWFLKLGCIFPERKIKKLYN